MKKQKRKEKKGGERKMIREGGKKSEKEGWSRKMIKREGTNTTEGEEGKQRKNKNGKRKW